MYEQDLKENKSQEAELIRRQLTWSSDVSKWSMNLISSCKQDLGLLNEPNY